MSDFILEKKSVLFPYLVLFTWPSFIKRQNRAALLIPVMLCIRSWLCWTILKFSLSWSYLDWLNQKLAIVMPMSTMVTNWAEYLKFRMLWGE